jgi:polysaccharide biosynthesis/export protein
MGSSRGRKIRKLEVTAGYGFITQVVLGVLLFVGLSGEFGWAQVSTMNTPESSALPNQNQTLLKSGDRINITVLGFPDLSEEKIISSDGTIQLPMVGNVLVNGLTPAQATERLMELLHPYVRRPQVSVSLLGIRPLLISVTGEVRRPGPLVVRPPESEIASSTQFTDVTEGEVYTLSYALVLAGGLTPNADLRKIVIRRRSPAQSLVAQADQTEIQVNLWEILQSGSLASDLRLQDGDEIIVPTAVLTSADQQQLLSSSLAPSEISIQVAGEVNRPGQIVIAPSADVSAAIGAAGGITTTGARSKIRLLRMAPNGQLEEQTFRFGEASVTLQEGDVIVVERKQTQRVLDVLGQVLNPLSFIRWLF